MKRVFMILLTVLLVSDLLQVQATTSETKQDVDVAYLPGSENGEDGELRLITTDHHDGEGQAIMKPETILDLDQLRAKFPNGKYWNHANAPGSSNSVNNQDGYTSTPCPSHNGTLQTSRQTCNAFQPGGTQLAWQCMGYAEKLGYDSTGYNPRENANGWQTTYNVSALDSLKPGDIVRYRNNGHSIFVTNVSGNTVTYTDCNGSGNCNIRWDVTISKADLRASFTYVRVSPGIGRGASDTCKCTKEYEGDYVVSTGSYPLAIRNGHGTQFQKIGDIPSGSICHVSMGDGTWAHVEYNGINGFCAMLYLEKLKEAPSDDTPAWIEANSESVHMCLPNETAYTVTVHCGGDLPERHYLDLTYAGGFSASFVGNWYGDNYQDILIRATSPANGSIVVNLRNSDTREIVASCVIKVIVDTNSSSVSFSLEKVEVNVSSTNEIKVYANGYVPEGCYFKVVSQSSEYFSHAWGSISGNEASLLVTGIREGTGSLTIALMNNDRELSRGTVSVIVTASPSSITSSVSSVSLSLPSHPEETVTIMTDAPNGSFEYDCVSSCFRCEWDGHLHDGRRDLRVIGQQAGSGNITVRLKDDLKQTILSSLSLHVEVAASTHIVSYWANDSKGVPEPFEKTYGSSILLTKNTPERFPYNFAGWSGQQNASSPTYLPGGTFDDDNIPVLYAVWGNPRQKTLPFDDQFSIDIPSTPCYVEIHAMESGKYTVSSYGDIDSYGRLYDEDGALLSQDDDGKDGRNFQITYDFSYGEVYYLKVMYFKSTAIGSFGLTATKDISVERYAITYDAQGGTGSPAPQTKEKGVPLRISEIVPRKTYAIAYDAMGGIASNGDKILDCGFNGWNTSPSGNGVSYQPGQEYNADEEATLYAQWVNPKIGEFPFAKRSGYTFEGWFTEGGNLVDGDTVIVADTILYAHWQLSKDDYAMGEWTYTFANPEDGYGFGMSIASAGCYLEHIQAKPGNLAMTEETLEPIRQYQQIQGSIRDKSTVAGGSMLLDGSADIVSDWKQVIAYVRNHEYDGTGGLQVGFYKKGKGGQATNFLRYEQIHGQDRIYVYDNNYPSQESYFYKNEQGDIVQMPESTFSGAIDCIALRDLTTYFKLVENYKESLVIYADKEAITIENLSYTYLETGKTKERIMYEIPEGTSQVIITPKHDNASFTYMGKEYSFVNVNGAYGTLTLENNGITTFEIHTPDPAACRVFGFCSYQGKDYWYEDGIRQAVKGDPKNIWDTTYNRERGREIYDPESDGWYWLDCIYDGAKASNKEVWMPYIYQDDLKKGKNKDGKWVRYDKNGRMIKGWYTVDAKEAEIYPKQAGNTYYYNLKTGEMSKGWLTVDGKQYHFDEKTGVLVK